MRIKVLVPVVGFAVVSVVPVLGQAGSVPAATSPVQGAAQTSTQTSTQTGGQTGSQTGSQPGTQTGTQTGSQTGTPGAIKDAPQNSTQQNSTQQGTPAPSLSPRTGPPDPDAPQTPDGQYPTPKPLENVPSYPPYQGQPATVQTVPAPTRAPQPSIVPAAPTADAPYVAMPPYLGATAQGQAQPPYQPYGTPDEDKAQTHYGSAYIPVDSWVYPEMTRLYSLGYVSTMFLSMRPWTRQTVTNMLDESEDEIRNGSSDEAKEIFTVLRRELTDEIPSADLDRGLVYGTESVYTRAMGISGQTLRDSYHLGQTINNDYGRPYEPGFNLLAGFSTIAEYGRFSLYVRGEYEHAPGAAGYSQALAEKLTNIDQIPYTGFAKFQRTLPIGPIAAANPFRLVEATLSYHILGHEISLGKSDAWLGPGQGSAMAWSNNAEDIYSFRINRVDPLEIPLISKLLGPVRYDFMYGSLKGHTVPNHPYVHSLMFAFRPTSNFEFGFQRTVIFGGAGHEPVTIHNFLRSFLSISDTTAAQKLGPLDPGARFSDFNFSYRLPFVRNYATLYVDAISHDDVTPISAPRRASYRTGLYLSHVPGMPKLDLRAEGVTTDPGVRPSYRGQFAYYEIVQQNGYTNQGFILGDWIGREAKGGQAWITYHLSGNEWVQAEYLRKKNAKDFIQGDGPRDPVTGLYTGNGGTTQDSFQLQVVKRLMHEQLELNGKFQYEKWKAPIYLKGPQSNTVTSFQLTYYPGLKTSGQNKARNK